MMKRYMVFLYNDECAYGGINDLKDSVDSLDEVRSLIINSIDRRDIVSEDQANVFDTFTMCSTQTYQVIESSSDTHWNCVLDEEGLDGLIAELTTIDLESKTIKEEVDMCVQSEIYKCNKLATTWVTREGEVLEVKDMETAHIINCMELMKTHLTSYSIYKIYTLMCSELKSREAK